MRETWTVVKDHGIDLGGCEDGPSVECDCGHLVYLQLDGRDEVCGWCGRRYQAETVVRVAPPLTDWKSKLHA